jgi:hypothetical protein
MPRSCGFFAATLLGTLLTVASAQAAYILTPMSGGASSRTVQPGETISLDLVLTSDASNTHTSAVFDVVFSAEGLRLDSYSWGGSYSSSVFDNSSPLNSALAAMIMRDLNGNAESPIDVHFENFTMSPFGTGTLVSMLLHVPGDFTPVPSTIEINAVSDTITGDDGDVITSNGQTFFLNIVPVPEPSSLALAAAGAIIAFCVFTRRRYGHKPSAAIASLFIRSRTRRSSRTFWLLSMTLAQFLAGSNAQAVTIGPGALIPTNTNEGPGERNFVDISTMITLPAGDYSATTFRFTAELAGQVQPYLAILVDGTPNLDATYKYIATGGNNIVDANSGLNVVPFGGSNDFTLDAPTTVYAGFLNAGPDNPIRMDIYINRVDVKVVGGVAVAGDTVTDFLLTGLDRAYAFDITIVPVPIPEPSSAVLLAIGTASLALRFRRRRTASSLTTCSP